MRSNKIIALANCCLNQNTVIIEWERASGAYPFTYILIEKGIGIIQLSCPEILSKGLERPPLEYNDYNTKEHRNLCKIISEISVNTIKAHVDGGAIFLGTIGINESPNCSITGQRGVFMEEYFKLLEDHGLNQSYLEVPTDYVQGEISKENEFNQKLIKFIGL